MNESRGVWMCRFDSLIVVMKAEKILATLKAELVGKRRIKV